MLPHLAEPSWSYPPLPDGTLYAIVLGVLVLLILLSALRAWRVGFGAVAVVAAAYLIADFGPKLFGWN